MGQWIMSQIGSRQHYGVPRGFEAIGKLKRFYTDAWCPRPLIRLFRRGNGLTRAFSTRWHRDLPRRKIVSDNLCAIRDASRRARNAGADIEWQFLEHLRIGRQFDEWVLADLQRPNRIDPSTDAFFGFNTASLKTIRFLRSQGIVTVLDQVDPGKLEEDIVIAEAEKWPGWERSRGRAPQAYWDRIAQEWAEADLVLVNSIWSQTSLIRQGVPAEKIRVIPVAYEPNIGPVPLVRQHDGPLTVLWLGSVILRKGIQYLIEAARQLDRSRFNFVIAGPVGISPAAVATAPPNMTFLGKVTRDQIDDIYRRADVFVLPTLSDGFAFTQVEAMSKGLPVITTPNCGEVVTDGKDGLIVPAADAFGLAGAMNRLDQDRALLQEMSHNAFIRSTQFLMPTQARQVEAAVQELKELPGSLPSRPPQRRFTFAQIGSRDLYLCPIIFERRGTLRYFYTDLWCAHFRWLVSRLPAPIWALARRFQPEVPRAKVTSFTFSMLLREGRRYFFNWPRSTEAEYEMHLDIGAWFARRVARHLPRHNFDPARDVVFTYGSGALEIMRQAHRQGIFSAIVQLDLAEVEQGMVIEEAERWKGWASLPGIIPQSYYQRLRQEWAEADVIFVCSEFTRRAIIQQGGKPEKLVVLPLAYEPEAREVRPRVPNSHKPLDVLWLGQVIIRKGIQYLFEAARLLENEPVRFFVAGPIGISEMALKSAPKNVQVLGKVKREKAVELYSSCDVFVLPTIADAFAITQLEAMSHGLPVIATPNCGDVVTPGVDGELVPIRDPHALAAAIRKLASDRNLLASMSAKATEKSRQFTMNRYHDTIQAAVERLSAARPGKTA
jgi:glycosyltransferase involved in cell wall biosynthesis